MEVNENLKVVSLKENPEKGGMNHHLSRKGKLVMTVQINLHARDARSKILVNVGHPNASSATNSATLPKTVEPKVLLSVMVVEKRANQALVSKVAWRKEGEPE